MAREAQELAEVFRGLFCETARQDGHDAALRRLQPAYDWQAALMRGEHDGTIGLHGRRGRFARCDCGKPLAKPKRGPQPKFCSGRCQKRGSR